MIGAAIAERFAAEGATLVLTARSKDQLQQVFCSVHTWVACVNMKQNLQACALRDYDTATSPDGYRASICGGPVQHPLTLC